MAKQKDFDSFISNIEPSKTTVSYISSVQNNLREYLENHSEYKDIHKDTFLSGSYAKYTSIRPKKDDSKRDVDIIVVTNYSKEDNSINVLEELQSVLKEKDLYKTAKVQSHSVGIELENISIDVVPVIQSDNDDDLYLIGDSVDGSWTLTDPKGHKNWSSEVNKNNNSEYKPLVKIFKWWRRTNCIDDCKYPKGITLEKIIADNLGDSSLSTEDFLIETFNNIVAYYKEDYVEKGINPVIDDPSDKISDNDLLSGYSTEDFTGFINKLEEHIDLLNENGTSNDVWRQILGNEFPKDVSKAVDYSITKIDNCLSVPHRKKLLWPLQRGGAAFISLKVTDLNGNEFNYPSNGVPLPKGCGLVYSVKTAVKRPFVVKWQIVNTGFEATQAGCLRGGFENSDIGTCKRKEATAYSGTHFVQCFIIKNGVCVAKSKEFILNIE